jgi:glycosyltransferase involved in cell wall biosynthesis
MKRSLVRYNKKMKVALVYDRVNKWGGAERVLLALHEMWPEAPLFTAVYDKKRAPWANVFDVRTSFLQNIPFAVRHHEFFAWLTPLAFESFSFDEYDVIISVTSAEAKGIITKPHTCHICYCLTPTRYLWSGYDLYVQNPGLGQLDGIVRSVFPHVAPTLQRWDRIAAQKPDYYIAISQHVADRVEKYYKRKVESVIYPPVGIERMPNGGRESFFLTVSRLVGYKRIDIIVEAFNELGWPLIIIGDGRERDRLKNLAGGNISFVARHLTDEELSAYYRDCRAFVFAANEDFGIAAAEAQAFGKPVIAYKKSGVAEIVKDGQTGILFDKQTKNGLLSALRAFERRSFDPATCRKNALRFSKDRFVKEMKEVVEILYKNYIKS